MNSIRRGFEAWRRWPLWGKVATVAVLGAVLIGPFIADSQNDSGGPAADVASSSTTDTSEASRTNSSEPPVSTSTAPTTTAVVTSTVPPTPTLPPTPSPTAPPSSTTAAPTTTPVAPLTSSTGYAYLPKPEAGPNTVAAGGALTKHLVEDIAIAFGFDTAGVEAAIAAVELPLEADGNPEGWLAPGAYDPEKGATTAEMVQAMVDRRVAQLEARNVPPARWHEVLTAASLIETETYNQNEKPGVARVLTNRLAGGGPLQMDSIILYPVPEDRIFTTSEERASDQPYNSYRHDGLPPTPISSPDEASIDAFLDPRPGDWWFYVTIDLESGETRYAVTYEGHQDNVRLLRAWLENNPIP